MGIQIPGGGELAPMPKPEIRTTKPREVRSPEVKSLGQAETSMAARIDKDGDPDLILRDLAKPVAPQTSPSIPTNEPSGRSAENPITTKDQTGKADSAKSTQSEISSEQVIDNRELTDEGEIRSQVEWLMREDPDFKATYNHVEFGVRVPKDIGPDESTFDYAKRILERDHPGRIEQYQQEARSVHSRVEEDEAYQRFLRYHQAKAGERYSYVLQQANASPRPEDSQNLNRVSRESMTQPGRQALMYFIASYPQKASLYAESDPAVADAIRAFVTKRPQVGVAYYNWGQKDYSVLDKWKTTQQTQSDESLVSAPTAIKGVVQENGVKQQIVEELVSQADQAVASLTHESAYPTLPSQFTEATNQQQVEVRQEAHPSAATQSLTEAYSTTDTTQKELNQVPAIVEGQQVTQNEIAPVVVPKYEAKPVSSVEEVSQRVKEQVADSMKALTTDDLEKRRQELKNRPQIGSKALNDTLVGVDQQSTFVWVQTDKIVGRTWEEPDGWASEIKARKGRVVQVAKEIIDSDGQPQAMEHIFHPDKASDRIKLTAIDGPAGPMYYVDDGTHRVAASVTAGLEEIPCDVKGVTYPLEQITTDNYQTEDWQQKIELGLIDGEIQDYTSNSGEKMKKLVVRSEVLPWIRTASQSDLMKISRIYEQLYPGSLNNLKIPREALIDPMANNFFMAGRWEEWTQRQQELAKKSQ